MERTHVLDAADALARGGLVAFPTETVYGLGADAEDPAALRRLYAVKGRPAEHPVIVHVHGTEHLDRWAESVPPAARRLTEALWPGPLTVVLHRSATVPDEVTGGRSTVGLRSPAHPLAQALLEAFGGGVAAPSANRFGRVSPTTAADVAADLGADVDVVLDGGPCAVGVESTIVDCTGDEPAVLRPGGVPAEVLADVLGRPVPVRQQVGGAPGTLPSHYAPRARVLLVGDVAAALAAARPGAVVLLPGEAVPGGPDGVRVRAMGSAEAYAHDLYRALREADAAGAQLVVAVAPDGAGIGAAVADRLRRAAG